MVYLYVGEFPDAKKGVQTLLSMGQSDFGIFGQALLHDSLGRPFFSEGPFVSISHTAGAAAVALSEEGPVGVDLERIRKVRPRLLERVMSRKELEWCRARGASDQDFFTLWTLKESWYKYLGTGLPGVPNQTEFQFAEDRWQLSDHPQRFYVWEKELLSIALCCDEQEVCMKWVSGS